MIKKLYLLAGLCLIGVGCRPRSEAALSPDGNRVALATVEGLFVGPSGQALPSIPVVKGDVRKPEWSPDGALVAYSAKTGIRVLDVPSGRTSAVGKAQFPLAWSDDSTRLACVRPTKGMATQVVVFYRSPAANARFAIDAPIRAYDCAFSPTGLEISSDQKRVLAYNSDSIALFGDDGTQTIKPGGVIGHAAFTPDGGVLAAEIDKNVVDDLNANTRPQFRISHFDSTLKPLAGQSWQDVRELVATHRFAMPLSLQIRPSGEQFAWVTLIDQSPEGLLANYLRRYDQIQQLQRAKKPIPAAWTAEQKARELRMSFDVQVGVADLNGKTTYSTTVGKWTAGKTDPWESIAWSRNGRLAIVYSKRTQMLDLSAVARP